MPFRYLSGQKRCHPRVQKLPEPCCRPFLPSPDRFPPLSAVLHPDRHGPRKSQAPHFSCSCPSAVLRLRRKPAPDSSLSDFLLYPPPPAIRAPALCGERTCKQHRSQTKYKSTFHVSIHFSYSSLTFTTRTGWVAGTNPDFNIIRCPRSEARKEANPHGSALRGSFNKA